MSRTQVLYILLPILIPVGISIALVRFTLATRSSRARIRLLEQDESKLAHYLREFEKDVEDVVVNLIDDSNPSFSGKHPSEHPIITPLQRRMAASLNGLPIKKERAYLPHVRNSHAIIVCRDVKRFELHRRGEGVIRHWATSFIL